MAPIRYSTRGGGYEESDGQFGILCGRVTARGWAAPARSGGAHKKVHFEESRYLRLLGEDRLR